MAGIVPTGVRRHQVLKAVCLKPQYTARTHGAGTG